MKTFMARLLSTRKKSLSKWKIKSFDHRLHLRPNFIHGHVIKSGVRLSECRYGKGCMDQVSIYTIQIQKNPDIRKSRYIESPHTLEYTQISLINPFSSIQCHIITGYLNYVQLMKKKKRISIHPSIQISHDPSWSTIHHPSSSQEKKSIVMGSLESSIIHPSIIIHHHPSSFIRHQSWYLIVSINWFPSGRNQKQKHSNFPRKTQPDPCRKKKRNKEESGVLKILHSSLSRMPFVFCLPMLCKENFDKESQDRYGIAMHWHKLTGIWTIERHRSSSSHSCSVLV